MSMMLNSCRTLGAIFLLLSTPLLMAARPTAPATQNEKESYSIGYQVGLSMKTDGVQVDLDKLVQGMQDAIVGFEAAGDCRLVDKLTFKAHSERR